MAKYQRRSLKYRKRAPKSIQKAWRDRKRRKVSLNARTTLSNYRQIKKLKRSVETKMIETTNANAATHYGGQYYIAVPIDIDGHDGAGAPVVLRLAYDIVQGVTAEDRVGDSVILKSVTIKTDVQLSALAADAFNKVQFALVLDRNPMLADNLTLNQPGLDQLLEGMSNDPGMQFQNLANCQGPDARFKILRRWQSLVAPASSNGHFPPTSQKTVTFKAPYKFNYLGAAPEPINQSLLMFVWSDSRLAPHPIVTAVARVRYKDA